MSDTPIKCPEGGWAIGDGTYGTPGHYGSCYVIQDATTKKYSTETYYNWVPILFTILTILFFVLSSVSCVYIIVTNSGSD